MSAPAAALVVAATLALAAAPDAGAREPTLPSLLAHEADCDPEGRVDETFANGARWELCVESRVRENLVLRHVTYTPPSGVPFAVLASANLAQLHVAYDDNDVTYNDITQYGLGGGYLVELTAADCPDGTLMDVRTRPGICRTRGVGDEGFRDAARAVDRESVELYAVSQVGAYTYLQSWTLHDDGAIEPVIGATGALQRSSADTTLPFGRVLSGEPDTLWLSHAHNYHWRLDFDVGANADDDVITETRHPLGADGRRLRLRETFERERARRIEPTELQAWHVWESDPAAATGPPRGYVIEPGHHGHRFERTAIEPHTAFDVFVTVARDCERFASQNARYNPDCLDDVLEYVDGEALAGRDLVLWHRVGFHHVPRDEDRRHMHAHRDGFVIAPVNVSATNPALPRDGNAAPVLAPLAARTDQVGDDILVHLDGRDDDGDPLLWTAENLPPGVRLEPDGHLAGRLDAAGDWRVEIRVDDGRAAATDTFLWHVADAPTQGGRGGGAPALAALIALAALLVVRERGRRDGRVAGYTRSPSSDARARP